MSILRRMFRPRDGKPAAKAAKPTILPDAVNSAAVDRACHKFLMKRDPAYKAEWEASHKRNTRRKKTA